MLRLGFGLGGHESDGKEKRKLTGIEARPPWIFLCIVETVGCVPMPSYCVDAIPSIECNDILDRGRVRSMFHARWGIIHEIRAEDGWCLADILLDPSDTSRILLAREVVVAILLLNILEKIPSFGCGLRIDGCVCQVG